MGKKTAFAALGITVIIAAALTYTLLMSKNGTIVRDVTKNEPATGPQITQPQQTPGAYVAYTKEAVLATPGTKLLFFYAPWCPQCRSIDTSIVKDGVPNGVTVFKVDYDSNQKLRQQYGVTLQTTFVKVDDAGNKTASYVAYDEPQFSTVVRELLP